MKVIVVGAGIIGSVKTQRKIILVKMHYPCCRVILQRDVSAMPCISCNSSQLVDLKERTSLGYRQWPSLSLQLSKFLS